VKPLQQDKGSAGDGVPSAGVRRHRVVVDIGQQRLKRSQLYHWVDALGWQDRQINLAWATGKSIVSVARSSEGAAK
jgi:hypothetical protein